MMNLWKGISIDSAREFGHSKPPIEPIEPHTRENMAQFATTKIMASRPDLESTDSIPAANYFAVTAVSETEPL